MLCNWLQIYYKTLLKPTDFLKKTTSPPALLLGSLSPSLPEREGRTYSLNNRLLVSPLPLEGDGGGFFYLWNAPVPCCIHTVI